MCRHLAYLGSPVTISSVLVEPPHGLLVQAWAPRWQRHGMVNADGFGVGWYAAGDPLPARYRRDVPIWGDESFADLARVTRTGGLLAAVRSATPGTDGAATSAAPYRAGSWLFSHNGAVPGWPEALAGLAGSLPPADLLALSGRCDSALVWALVLARLRSGSGPAEALAATIGAVRAVSPQARLNLLLTDGRVIAATAAGDTLCFRQLPGSVTVASEPSDDAPDWSPVPDGSVLRATSRQVTVRELPALAGAGRDGTAEA
jgi:gamma-glutamyl hercynylcysteine S-oxide hydrolase